MKSQKQITIETDADVFTQEEFKECVEYRLFTPYDGNGYFHDGTNETDISVWDNSLTEEGVKKYPYICWYNA